jgi:hypothetical protein
VMAAAFTVTLTTAYPLPVTVTYSAGGGTATSGTDYTAAAGVLTFEPSEVQKVVIVPILGDQTVEPQETFNFTLSNAVNGTVVRSGTGTIQNDDPPAVANPVTVWRLYSPVTREHHFTTDSREYAALGTTGWTQEGAAFRMFGNSGLYSGTPTIPFYRLFDDTYSMHHLTTDANEVRVLSGLRNWHFEGYIGFMLAAPATGTTPLYRLFLPGTPIHLWTIDSVEHTVLQTRGWRSEGVVGHVLR